MSQPEPMRTLALETSSQTGSVALLENDRVVDQSAILDGQRTSRQLVVAIQNVLASAGWSPSKIDLVAVTQGPGSFTGLRIGVTTAKTFAYATGAALLGVNSLEVIANQCPIEGQRLWAVMDAQRQQLFVGRFSGHHSRHQQWEQTTQIADRQAWLDCLRPGDLVSGAGLERIVAQIPKGIEVVPDTAWRPVAATVAQLALRRFRDGDRDDVWKLLPEYYRPSAAEEKLG